MGCPPPPPATQANNESWVRSVVDVCQQITKPLLANSAMAFALALLRALCGAPCLRLSQWVLGLALLGILRNHGVPYERTLGRKVWFKTDPTAVGR